MRAVAPHRGVGQRQVVELHVVRVVEERAQEVAALADGLADAHGVLHGPVADGDEQGSVDAVHLVLVDGDGVYEPPAHLPHRVAVDEVAGRRGGVVQTLGVVPQLILRQQPGEDKT